MSHTLLVATDFGDGIHSHLYETFEDGHIEIICYTHSNCEIQGKWKDKYMKVRL